MNENRNTAIDILRIYAYLGVVAVHTHPTCGWLVTGGCVPLFVVISGYLLLAKDITIRTLFSKYLLRIVTAFAVWSIIYAMIFKILFPYFDGDVFDKREFLIDLVSGHYHMWFLFLILGLYLMIPVYKMIVDSKIGEYVIVILFVFSVILPSIQEFTIFNWSKYETDIINLSSFLYPLCFITGGFIYKHKNDDYRIIAFVLLAISIILRIVGVGSQYCEFAFPVTVCYFADRYIVITNIRAKRILMTIAEATFGAYLVHALVVQILLRYMSEYINDSTNIVMWIMSSVLSLILGYLVHRIPKIAKYIS